MDENYDDLYASDREDQSFDYVTTGIIRSSENIIYNKTYFLYSQEVEYDEKLNCLKINVKTTDKITFYFLTKFLNFTVAKEWIFNKDLICIDNTQIDLYKQIKNSD